MARQASRQDEPSVARTNAHSTSRVTTKVAKIMAVPGDSLAVDQAIIEFD